MTTLKMREDINLLEVENIFFLLLYRNVATGLSLFVGYDCLLYTSDAADE